MKKRILCMLLIICILCSLIPFSAYAEEFAEGAADGSELLRAQWLEDTASQAVSIEENTEPASVVTITDGVAPVPAPTAMLTVSGQQTASVSRYTVLVLDVSGSMGGTPMTTCKTAAKKFCEAVLQANGNNHVAVVTYATRANTICNFTNNLTTLQTAINNIYASGGTNTNAGLQYADTLLSAIPDAQGIIKNVLLLSDGMPNEGSYSYSGHYTYNDYYYYQYANAVYNTASALKDKGYSIYTLGFFHGLRGSELAFARRFMDDLQNAGYYDVVDASNLEFVFGEIANDILKKTGTFRYRPGVGEARDYSATYFYDDTYFAANSYTYNESLATMSLCLAMSAFASTEKPYLLKSDNARDLLEQVGFADFRANHWYTVKPTRDSIGVVAANKKIKVNNKPYTLIAVATRGGGYEQEWASNFTLGETGQHQGFNEAKDNVLSFIRDYIAEQGITGDVKLWIAGFSRGAATANLTAGAIDSGANLGNVAISPSDLYAYCFETPAGTLLANTNQPVHNNIFNIINFSDPVTYVAPRQLGFTRYGIDKILPTAATDSSYSTKQKNMLKIYDALESTTEPYVVDNFTMKKITIDFSFIPHPTVVDDTKNKLSQGVFLMDFITKISKEQFKSRSNYVVKYQDGIREIFGVLNGTEDAQWKDFTERFKAKLNANIGWLIVSTTKIGELTVGSTTELIEKYAVESLNEAGITSYNKEDIHKLAATLASTITEFAISHPNLTTTLVCNIKGIGAAHYPELCLAWLQSMDKNYTTNAAQGFNTGSYRIIRINCPIDVEVYDAGNQLVAAIKSDDPQALDGSSIISAVNEDGEKLIYLPATAAYQLKLAATDSGKMTYSINEFSYEAGDITRIVNYYDIEIEQGDILNSSVPAYSTVDLANGTTNGSSAVYSLFDTNNNAIAANVELTGTNAADAYYMVTVVANNEEYGYVTGQGIRQLGNYAQVTAVPYQDCKFDGWYTNGQKVSTEPTYRFRVQSDVELTAKFIKNQPPDVTNAAASVPVVWPPNNKLVEIEILNVVDPDGDPVAITITEITQDEPLTNKTEGDASGIGTDHAMIRASREGNGNGRVYRISFIAKDDKGGESSGYVYVQVPHDQKKKAAVIDDGQKYNSVVK